MRRIVCTEFGELESLEVVEEPTPAPSRGELLIEIEATGVSFVDGLVIKGAYQVRPRLPFTPGHCLAGVVAAVGDGVDPAVLGRRVAAGLVGAGGAYASHVVVPAAATAAVPSDLSAELVAGSMESYLTLCYGTKRRVSIAPEEEVVVLGAGGGIGTAAVDIARSLGACVTAVASTGAKRAAALEAGARSAIGYDDLKNQIRAVTGGGADVIIDPVGGGAAESAMRALNAGGRYCVVGFASGEIPRIPINLVLLRNRSIIGIDWGDWSREKAGSGGNARLLEDIFARISGGGLSPRLPMVAKLDDAPRILTLIAERRAVGRYVLQP